MYCCTLASTAILASGHGATAGFFWLLNPAASGKLVEVRGVDVEMTQAGATVAVTAPLLSFERMTFSGAIGGNAQTICKAITDDVAPVGDVRDAAPGSPSASAVWTRMLPVSMQSASGAFGPCRNPFRPQTSLVLKAGEGLVVRQEGNGTTSDTRRFIVTLYWSEGTRLFMTEPAIDR